MTWIGPDSEGQVAVPDVVGLTMPQARRIATEAGLVLATRDPDGPPLIALTWRRSCLVIAQHPLPGSVMHRKGSLQVDFHEWPAGDIESGDREPRRPLPRAGAPGAERDPADDDGWTGELA